MMTTDPTHETDPAKTERLAVHGGILPGMAAIAIFLLLVTMFNAFAAIHGVFGTGPARYGICAACTLLAAGIFGLLRLSRWGWALVTAGCLVMAVGDGYLFGRNHVGFFAVRGLLELCFFLYLIRTEVRDRLRSPIGKGIAR
jgi:hypothetical protein